jgi:hypothetical protein
MPLVTGPPLPVPNFWTAYGHSYFMYAFGTRTPAGRADSIFRNTMNVDHTSWRNFAVAGSRLIFQGASTGGWVRPMSTLLGAPPGATSQGAPYISQGGAYLLCWGLNDVGYNGNTAQNNAAFASVMTAVISRCRASVFRPSNYAGAAGTGTIAYVGFTNFGTDTAAWIDQSSNGFVEYSTTVGNTITITLPSDYNGETVVTGFLGTAGVTGGTLTYSGTAGVTGTLYTGNVVPAASLGVPYIVRRITGLTSANASQTIIMTVSSLDSGGSVTFDGFWLEADNPPPVLVCNIARPTNAGYVLWAGTFTATALSGTAVSSTPSTVTLTGTWGLPTAGLMTIPSAGGTVTLSWTGTTTTQLTGVTTSGGSGNYSSNSLSWGGPTDTDVAAINAVLPAVIASFDTMVQLVDIDSAVAKTAAWFGPDGVHLNEIGAARVADAMTTALRRCVPNTPWGNAASLEQESQRSCAVVVPMSTGFWYTSDAMGGVNAAGTNPYTPVAGDWWAMPFMQTTAWIRWIQWEVSLITNSSNPSVYVGLYDDRNFTGYPCQSFNPPANVTPLALSGTGLIKSTTTFGQNGYVNLPLDPGLYWLAIGISVAGTCTMSTVHGPSNYIRQLSSAGALPTGAPCAYKLTGQGTGAMPVTFPPGGVAADNAPFMALLMQ